VVYPLFSLIFSQEAIAPFNTFICASQPAFICFILSSEGTHFWILCYSFILVNHAMKVLTLFW
jgi:hypothetical protein